MKGVNGCVYAATTQAESFPPDALNFSYIASNQALHHTSTHTQALTQQLVHMHGTVLHGRGPGVWVLLQQ